MKAKALLQKEIILYLLGENSTQEERMKWIEASSSVFRNYFDARKDDREFISIAINAPKSLAMEVAHEVFPGSQLAA